MVMVKLTHHQSANLLRSLVEVLHDMPSIFSDIFHRSRKQPVVPPSIPSIPSIPRIRRDEDLVQAFNPLSLQDNYRPSLAPQISYTKKLVNQDGFVGGFMPLASGSRPHPRSYPGQSLTMSHALQDPEIDFESVADFSPAPTPASFTIRHGKHSKSDSHVPRPQQIEVLSSSSPSPTITPRKPKGRARSASLTSDLDSPSQLVGNVAMRCNGITKQNKRCTRLVKSGPPLATMLTPGVIEVYCHHHNKEILVDAGFYSRRNGKFVTFSGEA